MKKVTISFFAILFLLVFVNTNTSYAFSTTKRVASYEALKYLKCSEFVKLSFKEFAHMTGEKTTLLNYVAFKVMKSRMKHELKSNHDLTLNSFVTDPKHKGNAIAIVCIILAVLLVALLIGLALSGGAGGY